jgi:hypothetical protein
MKVSEDWIENQLTSIEYGLLSGPPSLNPRAVDAILRDVDGFIERWMRYPDDLKKIRQLILDMNGVDIFTQATTVPDFLR